MSISGVKVIAGPIGVRVTPECLCYSCVYSLSREVNGVNNGEALFPVGEQTESEVRALMHHAVRDHANLQTSNIEDFTLADIIGGVF